MNAAEALAISLNGDGFFKEYSSSFNCPHCGSYAQHLWGIPIGVSIPYSSGRYGSREIHEKGFIFSACTACHRECILFCGKLIYPHAVTAPLPHPDLPSDLAVDFEEARQISQASPRGAAALLRLVIQKLCPLIGADENTIDQMIAQLVREDKISLPVQKAMDSLRVIGNESVHPGTLDIRDNDAMAHSLFELVNFVVEKTISEPKKIEEIFSGLPSGKLDGIERRDSKR